MNEDDQSGEVKDTAPAPEESGDGVPAAAAAGGSSSEGPVSLRGVFLGNLSMGFRTEEVTEIFTKPIIPRDLPEDTYKPVAIDRVDLKRGYCFVFLKDVANMAEKEQVERFVSDINGMAVPNVSSALRAEFARGDGRVKRKEDERRRNIQPSETLFVVNFHEETTKKEDLEMLFGPFGELVRIDMKGNYAFVQFRTVDESMRAKEATNGGKLDRSVLTVEYVANRRGDQRFGGPGGGGGAGGGRGGGGGGWRGGDRDRDRRYDDRSSRGPSRGAPPSRYSGSRYDRDRSYDRDRGRGDRHDDRRGGSYRDRSPPARRRSRSRSRSNSPPRYDDRDKYDSRSRYEGGGGGGGWRDRRRSRSRERRPPSPGGYRDRDPADRGDRDFYRSDRGGSDRGYRG
ncbi:Serine/arginine-rich splicing factor [Seminavis robusta]|uniref:Serine/arginine-rich splicing factor n=1 Tax=Seminavis robusta TaxID=568900 RepID=A0A9N8HAW5_9STRA|nr:Serine/arginine-rich splicing factor [Seminavis robusta]|eukprot:Sro336_g120390.1 Serine/arginine-rich splicing factor (398) ;mRNA; f:58044-59589